MPSPLRSIFLPFHPTQIVQCLSLGLYLEYLVFPSTMSHHIITGFCVLDVPPDGRVFEYRVHAHLYAHGRQPVIFTDWEYIHTHSMNMAIQGAAIWL